MKPILGIIVPLALITVFSIGCTKETIIKEITHDTTIIKEITRDTTIIRSPSTQELLIGKSSTTHHEFEVFTNGILTSKSVTYFTGFYFEVKADGTYNVKNQDGITSGTWELSSPNYLLLDKNTSNDRYFYILYIDPKSYLLRGPFKKNGDLKYNYLANTYYEKQ